MDRRGRLKAVAAAWLIIVLASLALDGEPLKVIGIATGCIAIAWCAAELIP